ncbi:helix-turn-helix DNA binding domain protein [Mycobacterium phage Stasia]|uniref:Helix-turn-helix DNA binding domain protein n=1 Tax=Mycobacterium phage Stasia TaxID=1897548 RepID=A0A1D8EUF4_9CAUD|nr:helix-turn-helix DNA-binding protein [Mycobacterium phage Stasia]AOT24695.1 helix-turn-helix DNA binding domain protein [Mycobacterium phage Stasia]
MTVQDTSIESYHQIKPILPEREVQALSVLQRGGPLCNLELADILGLPINSVTPTTYRLRERGLVVESHRAKYEPTNRTVIYWRAAA